MIALLLCAACAVQGPDGPPPFDPPALVPPARSVQPRFAPFTLNDSSRVVAMEADLAPMGRVLRDHLERVTGRPFVVGEAPARGGDFILARGILPDEVAGLPEAFAIEVFGDNVQLSAESPEGIARAAARVLQLIDYDADQDQWSLPAVHISDAPLTPWRGVLLDLARFPHPIDAVEEAVDLAYLYGLNTVHLHLSDDQAFTFPASVLPPRTNAGERGADRGYTKDELLGLIAFASARSITLIPEIDMPAHASALVKARPDLFGKFDEEPGEWVTTGIINIASEPALEATAELLAEVADLFHASPMIHLGGDEVWEGHIKALPDVNVYGAAHGLPAVGESGAANEYLNHFLQRMTGVVRELGRQPVLWEGFRPPMSEDHAVERDVIVMSWSQHSQHPEALALAGYSVVNCGWDPLYVVPAQGWAARPSEAFEWNVRQVRQRFGGRTATLPDEAPLVGTQICVWEQRPEAIVPALQRVLPELATRMWGSAAPGTLAEFEPASRTARTRLDGVLRPVAFDVQGLTGAAGTLFQERVSVELRTKVPQLTGTLRYVLGTSFDEPVTAESAAYEGKPIVVRASGVLSAALFTAAGARVGGVTRVRFEKGVPVLEYEAYEIPSGEDFGAASFAASLSDKEAFIGSGVLATADKGRIMAINRELFAQVAGRAHVDLRPLSFDTVAGTQRIDDLRPRIWGPHAVRAVGQITIPEAGQWTFAIGSRSGLVRVRVGGVVVGSDRNGLSAFTGTLAAGTYSLEIEQAVPDVHNDVQISLGAPGAKEDRPLHTFLRPIAAWLKPYELGQVTDVFTAK